jgi:dienelactone hydrolase
MSKLFVLLFLTITSSSVLAEGKNITYEVNGKSYEGYYTSPKDNAPLVLLVHDWDGLTDYEVKRAKMLSKQGYSVFAADLFGAGIRPTEVVDKRQHTGELYKDRNKMRALMDGSIKTAQSLGANIDNAVAVGYCFGGASILELARSGSNMKGFVTLHGGLSTPPGQDYSKTKAPVVVMHGTADTHITMDQFAKLADELEEAKVPHEMISYGGAPHAFTVFGGDRYREDADKQSWDRLLKFLNETL